MINNPFDITKAVDYTDAQIYKYWVDLGNENSGFEALLKPDTLMPMIIVGGKGSGKTHMMKYFSYEVQKIRCESRFKSMQEGLKKEKFIGVYIRCSGFNSDKFSGKGVNDEQWSILHAYFWELWIGERLINMLMDLLDKGLLDDVSEQELVCDILGLFLKFKDNIKTLKELNDYILEQQREVDYQVQNFMFIGQSNPNVEILLDTAKLTYGIPTILKRKISFFKDKYILYLIDELENFSDKQQQLIQTLIREKPASCTFRIGSRLYGIRTYKTLRDVEENHDGAEFERIILDDFLRNYESYPEYIRNILKNRLNNSGLSLPRDYNVDDLFEEQSDVDIIQTITLKKESQSRSYIAKLKTDLKKIIFREKDIDVILEHISFPNDILVERTSVMIMYRVLNDYKQKPSEFYKRASKEIYESAINFTKHNVNNSFNPTIISTSHAVILDKFKKDLIDNLARESNVDIPYNGLKRLIELSCGTPRTILCLLKAAFNNQYFNTGKVPFEEGRKLTAKSQQFGIESTYEWFFEENRIPSTSKVRTTDAISRIGNYFRSVRFSNVPPQCSINIFTLNPNELSDYARYVFETLLSYSYIVQTDERRQINSDNKTHVYRLNAILIPKYELALSKRGVINLTVDDAEFFFNLGGGYNYEKFVTSKLKCYNFPFSDIYNQQQLSLFQDPVQ